MSVHGFPQFQRVGVITLFLNLLCLLQPRASAQLLGYESFALPVQSGLTGSGTGASGWLDSGWSGGADARFQIVAPVPSLSYQLTGGPLVDGSTQSLQLTTGPEPVPNGAVTARRSFPLQKSTLFVSFLVRPLVVGTGSDSIEVQLNSGFVPVVRIALMPDLSQQFLQPQARVGVDSLSSGASFGSLYPGQTYLVVARISKPFPGVFKVEGIVNPPATIPSTFTNSINGNPGQVSGLDTVAVSVASSDTGGPTTTAIIDELRIGYTWSDVVPQSPQSLVPAVTINNAVNLQWQTQTGHTYQPQYSFDLSTWFNLGSSVTGDGTIKSMFDTSTSQAKKFYQIQIH